MKSLDEINYRYGSSTLRLAAEGIRKVGICEEKKFHLVILLVLIN